MHRYDTYLDRMLADHNDALGVGCDDCDLDAETLYEMRERAAADRADMAREQREFSQQYGE